VEASNKTASNTRDSPGDADNAKEEGRAFYTHRQASHVFDEAQGQRGMPRALHIYPNTARQAKSAQHASTTRHGKAKRS
jgi:hypothetical protein